MLMPVLGVATVNSIDEAISKAIKAENGCRHTAMMHSQNVTHLSMAAKALNTTIFVKKCAVICRAWFQRRRFYDADYSDANG